MIRFRYRGCEIDVPEIKSILEEGYMSGLSIHSCATKMYQELKKLFWWPGLKKEIVEFVYACLTSQKSEIEDQKLLDLMHPLFVHERKRDNILMDFMHGFPRTVKNCDSFCVIVDRLTKLDHFIPVRLNYPLERLIELCIENIINLYGIPSSIVSDRDRGLR